MDSPEQPPAPDPVATAQAQGAINKDTAVAQQRLNMVDQVTPYGTLTYEEIPGSESGGVPRYRATTALTPAQQQQLDIQQALGIDLSQLGYDQVGRISDAVSQPFSYDGLPAAPEADAAARQQVQDALYGRQTQYLDPQFADAQRALETDLVNRGFSVGSEGYTRAMDNFTRQRQAAYADARDSSIAGGGAEQSRLFGLQSAARDRGIQERLTERNMPINELVALTGAGPGIQLPQFAGTPQAGIAAPDYQGAVGMQYQGQIANAGQQTQARNATMGALFGLGGAAAGGFAGGAPFQNWMFG